jgi:hypothetical protein
MVSQHQPLGVRLQIHVLVHPVGNRLPVQVMLEQRHQRHAQRKQPLQEVLDDAPKLLPVLAGRGGFSSSPTHSLLERRVLPPRIVRGLGSLTSTRGIYLRKTASQTQWLRAWADTRPNLNGNNHLLCCPT